MARQEHILLREVEHEHRIVGDVVPVDELLDDVVVRLEGQDVGDDLDRELLLLGQPLDLRELAEVAQRVGPVPGAVLEAAGEAVIGLPEPVHLPELRQEIRLQVDKGLHAGRVAAAVRSLTVLSSCAALSSPSFRLPHLKRTVQRSVCYT